MQNTLRRSLRGLCCSLLTAVSFFGCFGGGGEPLPELTEVTGTITLDGNPLANVSVAFRPDSDGGTSRGTTDADGNFRLMYSPDAAGAVAGKHAVRMSLLDADAGADTIPQKYSGDASELTANVILDGPNDFAFALESE